jgi:fructose-specific component phosphotransferase system IIB-like protein
MPETPMPQDDPLFRRKTDVLAAQLSEAELVLLGPASERYVGLDPVAADVWAALETPRTLLQLAAALAEDYDAPPVRIAADIAPMLDQLVDEGLIERDDPD